MHITGHNTVIQQGAPIDPDVLQSQVLSGCPLKGDASDPFRVAFVLRRHRHINVFTWVCDCRVFVWSRFTFLLVFLAVGFMLNDDAPVVPTLLVFPTFCFDTFVIYRGAVGEDGVVFVVRVIHRMIPM